MFPIIPPNLTIKNYNNCTETISSFVTGSSKLLVPGKVIAASNIPVGALTEHIETERLLGQPDVVQISAQMSAFGMIELESKSKEIWCEDTHWIRALRLSDDCHSYNVQLKLQSSSTSTSFVEQSKLILQAVKPIETGQELLLWFSEEILAVLQIAFLTPANIQGQKKYVCTKCSALYESPNPLKLHITLSCGRYTIVSLWEKLSASLRENCGNSLTRETNFNFKLSSELPQLSRQRNAIDLSVTTATTTTINTEISKDLYRPYRNELSSAFKPFRKSESVDNSQLWPNFTFVSSNYQLPHHHHHQQQKQEQSFSENEAHIETLVSSLGKSKQGHICLYCGKCYSRKYGLKIHIRTHTGYKPLKCKYCLRPFGDPSNLNKHVRLHAEGNTPYRCDLCGKVLVRRRDLDRHLKSRHLIDIHPGMNIIQESSNLEDNQIVEDTTKD